MKQSLNLLLILFLGVQLFAQQATTPYITNNVETSTFIQYIPTTSDFVLAYAEESYWWSNTENFKLLSRKGNEWTTWTYNRKWKSSTDVLGNNGKKNKRYFSKGSVIDSVDVKELFDSLNSVKFWDLNVDSLNSTRGNEISDMVNYIFNIETKFRNILVESYAPDYYVKVFPDMLEKIIFIQGRDIFNRWWKKYSR
jgi:hypothetical protein